METLDDTIHNLIQVSKKLSDANRSKQNYELQLSQLTFFRNFSELISENEQGILRSIFHLSSQVIPDPEVRDTGESVFVTVENLNRELSFDSAYWYFTVSMDQGATVSVWNLEDSLSPGRRESFSTKFLPALDFSPVHLQISLTFSVDFDGKSFLRALDLGSIVVDILTVLDPVRRVPSFSIPSDSNSGPPYFRELDPDSADSACLPPLLNFNLKCNKALRDLFSSLLLADSRDRGFACGLLAEFESAPEFSVYVGDERIMVYRRKEGISIQTFDAKLLYEVKVGLFRRLTDLDELRVSCPDDEGCDALYRLKLRLESAGDNKNEPFTIGDFQELYLSLRGVTDGIRFYANPSGCPDLESVHTNHSVKNSEPELPTHSQARSKATVAGHVSVQPSPSHGHGVLLNPDPAPSDSEVILVPNSEGFSEDTDMT